MSIAVMITLLLLTPLFHYTPLVVLSSIIISAMLGIIDYNSAIQLWKVDKYDFFVCISSYIGVVFGSVEVGLIVAVSNYLLSYLIKTIHRKIEFTLMLTMFFFLMCDLGGNVIT